MSARVAKQAVVVGAGMGGLATAGALADHFEQVLVLERDVLPTDGSGRRGIPQGKHLHVLLAAGHQALGDLFPDFEQDLLRSGAVRVRVDTDMRREYAGHPPFPQRDAGFVSHAQSRPRLEGTVCERVRALANVTLGQECRAGALTTPDGGRTVDGVAYVDADGRSRVVWADLVVETTGRGNLTLDFLKAMGRPLPQTTTIGVDLSYSTAVFEVPEDAPSGWKGVATYPAAPESSRGALLMPLEGGRWIVSAGGRMGEEPPGDPDGFMAFVQGLHSSTIYDAISRAKRLGSIARYRFPESIRRHYARLRSFPHGLLPMADAICRFNPVYGQGMSVAAQEARALDRLLTERAGEPDPLKGLAPAFFEHVEHIIETPWMTAALPDLVYSGTRGERPADFAYRVRKGAALNALAAEDERVNKVLLEVRHLLKPHSAFDEPWLAELLAKTMAEA
ncbi:MAG: hypothetical protein P8099_13980 [Gemmatimonadota bacterium]|jgi:2-polyprenyl-6-methoxyphenol hydroxylase-like FAD-dependent oxidoreductase